MELGSEHGLNRGRKSYHRRYAGDDGQRSQHDQRDGRQLVDHPCGQYVNGCWFSDRTLTIGGAGVLGNGSKAKP